MKTYILAALATLFLVSGAYATTITLRPDGQGNYHAWAATGCSATSGYQCVDETVANTTDFLHTATNGDKETFSFSNTGLNGTVIAGINSVTLYYYAEFQTKAANSCFAAMTRANGTDHLSSTQICTNSTYALYSQTYATNPATGTAWTVSGVDALEAGMYALDPNGGGRVAQTYAVVDYTPSICGDNRTEVGEVCDGTDLSGQTCTTKGFDGGSLSCASDCQSFVTSACYNNSCSDSDGGFSPLVQGTVSGSNFGSGYSFTDVCIDSTFLREYFCASKLWANVSVNCTSNATTSCSMGACV